MMDSNDAISGKEGAVYLVMGDRRIQAMNLTAFTATMEKQKSEVRIIGKRSTGYKTIGWSGTGTMSFNYCQDFLRDEAIDYIKTGIDHYYEAEVINEDKSSRAGRRMAVIKHLNIDSIVLAQLDAEADTLQEDVPFTFEDAEVPTRFTDLPGME